MARKKKKSNEDENKPSKFKQLMVKFKFDNHHKMERYVVISIIFVLLFTGVLTGSMVKYRGLVKETESNLAIRTSHFESSLTHTSGDVIGVYRNKDWDKVYLLIHLNESESMTYDVMNYKVGICSWHHSIESKPSGTLQIFGKTGYVGIELQSRQKFPNDVWRVLVQIANGSEVTQPLDKRSVQDVSFAENDQFQMGINFGASKVEYKELFDSEPTASDIYKSLICGDEERAIKQELQSTVNSMASAQRHVEESKNRLQELGVAIPKLSDYYNGDLFVASKDAVEVSGEEDESESVQSQDEDGKPIVGYTFKPKSVFKGGYEYEWQKTDLVNGSYLKQVIPEGRDAEEYIEEQSAIAEDRYYFDEDAEGTDDYFVDDTETSFDIWYWSDTGTSPGKEIDLNSSLPRIEDISNEVSSFTSKYDEYLMLKKDYQQKKMKDLLYLELKANNLDATSAISVSDETVIIW